MKVTLEALIDAPRLSRSFAFRLPRYISDRENSFALVRKFAKAMYGSAMSIDKNAAVFIIMSSTSLGRNRELQVQNFEKESSPRSIDEPRLSSSFAFRVPRYIGDREISFVFVRKFAKAMYGPAASIDKNATVFIITSSTSLGRNRGRTFEVQNFENESFSRSVYRYAAIIAFACISISAVYRRSGNFVRLR